MTRPAGRSSRRRRPAATGRTRSPGCPTARTTCLRVRTKTANTCSGRRGGAGEGSGGFALEEDTVIELYDAAVNFIDYNDDINLGADNLCSRVTASLSAGTYYLVVYGFNGGSGGQYRVSARAGP